MNIIYYCAKCSVPFTKTMINTHHICQTKTKQKSDLKSKGIKYDQEKPLLALIPVEALEEEGWVWTFGAKKYGYYNWTNGLAYTRIISAMFRHMLAIMRGEDTDPESGRSHAAHIRCCAGMLIKFQKDGRKDLDDRNIVDTNKKQR